MKRRHLERNIHAFGQMSLFLYMCPISSNNFQTDRKLYEFHNTRYILCTFHSGFLSSLQKLLHFCQLCF